MKLSLIIAAILLIAGVAQASVLTVCPDGCNYTSIQAAVYAAHPNDTIEVQSGTYNESVILTKDVSFKGIDTGTGEAIVNGDLYKNGFNMTLHGFGFQYIGGLPYPEDMFTPNTTLYLIEKAFDNPSNAKAIAELNKILDSNPKDAWAWFRLGWVLYDSVRYDEATDAFNKSIEADPYFAAPWNEIGNDLFELNQYDKALKAYEKAIELRPGVGSTGPIRAMLWTSLVLLQRRIWLIPGLRSWGTRFGRFVSKAPFCIFGAFSSASSLCGG